MKALVLTAFGGPQSFELRDVPKPVPQAGQVLVRVHATSINPLDYQVRRGDYPDLVAPARHHRPRRLRRGRSRRARRERLRAGR